MLPHIYQFLGSAAVMTRRAAHQRYKRREPMEAEGSATPRRLLSPCDYKRKRRLLNVLSTRTPLPTPFRSCLRLLLNYFACVDHCRTRRLGLLCKINPARFTTGLFILVFFSFDLHGLKKLCGISNHRSIVHTASSPVASSP